MGSEHVYGDFTSRLETAVELVITSLREHPSPSQAKETVTNVLFEHEISKVRDAVVQLAADYKTITVLFDNIDKGWPATRVEEHDVKTVQHLINVMNKVQRELTRRDLDFEYLLFLRGDVYERLVENTADRGKFDPIKVDWSDPEQLSNLLHRRVISAIPEGKEGVAWNAVNPLMEDKRTAVDVMIAASLMRPRFLIDLAEKALSIAVNRGHSMITVDDVRTRIGEALGISCYRFRPGSSGRYWALRKNFLRLHWRGTTVDAGTSDRDSPQAWTQPRTSKNSRLVVMVRLSRHSRRSRSAGIHLQSRL